MPALWLNEASIRKVSMKIYPAAKYERHEEILGYAKLLEEDGHFITAYWITGLCVDWPPEQCALNDAANLREADCVLTFTSEQPGGAGHHTEFGMGLALGKRMVLVGPRKSVFHHTPSVEQYNTFEEARNILRHALPRGGGSMT